MPLDEEGREITVALYEWVVKSILGKSAHRYTDLEMDDLFQEGRIALMNAIPRWTKYRGAKFSTYATMFVTSRLADYAKSVRRARHEELFMDVADLEQARQVAVDPILDWEERQEQLTYVRGHYRSVTDGLDTLSEIQQSYLRDFLGLDGRPRMTVSGIATQYKVSKQTVSAQIKQAGRRLQVV
jgi:RNA polymerase sigma factor (sigma-70 family)